MHVFENLERRRKRASQGTDRAELDDLKQEGVGLEEGGASSPTGANPGQNAGLIGGVSTRRTSFATVSPCYFIFFAFSVVSIFINSPFGHHVVSFGFTLKGPSGIS